MPRNKREYKYFMLPHINFAHKNSTQCGLVMPYSIISLVNLGSSNGLLPDGTKPLPEPMLTNHQCGVVAFTWGQFHRKCSVYSSLVWVRKLLIYDHSCRGQWVQILIVAYSASFHYSNQCWWDKLTNSKIVKLTNSLPLSNWDIA